MSTKQTNTFWGILVVILIAIIVYMVIDKRDDQGYNEQTNQNTQVNTEQNNIANNETSTEPSENEKMGDWKTYTNTEYGFEFKFPVDGEVGTFENNGVRIDNLPNFQMKDFPEGKFSIQFTMTESSEPCQKQMKDPKEFMISDTVSYRGVALDGPWNGYAFNMCALKDGKNFILFVTDGYKSGDIAYKIMDSFKFTSNATAEWLRFYNHTGEYSFKYPPIWKAAINQYNTKGSLFGADASSTGGNGGVEVRTFKGTLKAYMDYVEKNSEVRYITTDNVTINGVDAIHVEYTGSVVSGFGYLLQKGDQVYSIFINTKKVTDITLFDKLANSFELK